MLSVHLLGGFRVVAGGREVMEDAWRLRKGPYLMQLLALAPHLRLHRDQVMEHLWPEANPASSLNSLHQVLHAARRALEPHLPRDRPSQYLRLHNDVLSLPPDAEIDVTRFEATAGHARSVRTIAAHEAALDLYAGDLLAHDPYAEWAEPRRSRLRELYLQLLLDLARLREAAGDSTGAAEALTRLLAAEPAREDGHIALMRLYAARGERPRALHQFELLADSLRRELDVAPGPEARALRDSLLESPAAPASAPMPPAPLLESAPPPRAVRRANLPLPLTSFVGRSREIETVCALLLDEGGRLITLTGAGGAGKSRLAVETARRLLTGRSHAFADGIWHVDLDALSAADTHRLAQRIASSLDLRLTSERDAYEAPNAGLLIRALETRDLLLILDGCEHVARSCAALITDMLTHCPTVRILATSREALRVHGERVWRVPPLSLPLPATAQSMPELEEYDAIRLFVERAAQSRPGFALAPQNSSVLADLCRRLDGLPLAIELAAARASVLTVEQIAERLDARFDLLTGGAALPARHQTLLAAMDWSHSLLSEPERILFRRLSAFERGWTLDEAEAVCADERLPRSRVLDLLTQLVDKSLVVAETDPAGPTHFHMLETVREYAWGELLAAGEAEATQARL